jgi:hypothetical protein
MFSAGVGRGLLRHDGGCRAPSGRRRPVPAVPRAPGGKPSPERARVAEGHRRLGSGPRRHRPHHPGTDAVGRPHRRHQADRAGLNLNACGAASAPRSRSWGPRDRQRGRDRARSCGSTHQLPREPTPWIASALLDETCRRRGCSCGDDRRASTPSRVSASSTPRPLAGSPCPRPRTTRIDAPAREMVTARGRAVG